MIKKPTKRAQVVMDEHSATVREAARQASVERERVVEAALEAEEAAQAEETAAKAKQTFWQKLKAYFADDGL
jgi:hypothetical protein